MSDANRDKALTIEQTFTVLVLIGLCSVVSFAVGKSLERKVPVQQTCYAAQGPVEGVVTTVCITAPVDPEKTGREEQERGSRHGA